MPHGATLGTFAQLGTSTQTTIALNDRLGDIVSDCRARLIGAKQDLTLTLWRR
jgi:hypothetical protein